MQKLVAYFFTDYRSKSQVKWFKRFLFVFLIIQCSYWLYYFDLFFGPDSIVFTETKSIGVFKDLAFMLYNSASSDLSLYFILGAILLSVINLFNIPFQFIPELILWFLVLNIQHKIYPTLTGGSFLLNQFLFFNCFLSGNFSSGDKWQDQLKIALHNFAVAALSIQICLVYFLSGTAKLVDDEWLNGTAVSAVSKVKHFSLFTFLSTSPLMQILFVFLTFVVLAYQILFPVLIWIKKIKKPLLIVGVLMHLYIAFAMGLVAFGFVMILAYVFFWPSKQTVS